MVDTLMLVMSLAESLNDPPGSSPLLAAMAWLQGTLLGTIATTVAVIAVAWVGMLMLTGRVNLRHGATVIFGCFLLFGASSIAAGIRATADGGGQQVAEFAQAPQPSAGVVLPAAPPPGYDPYAGAAVPRR